MVQAFIIHDKTCTERADLVMKLQEQTGASIVDAICLPNGVEGCLKSHLKVAERAKELYPDEPYIVFEDDCVLEEGWDLIFKEFPSADLIYLGYTEASMDTIFGTHGMLISPRLRDIIIAHSIEYAYKVRFPWAADWVIPKLCKDYGMDVYRPAYTCREKWCYQKKGMKSQITGKIRT
jgi:hypothetical protein